MFTLIVCLKFEGYLEMSSFESLFSLPSFWDPQHASVNNNECLRSCKYNSNFSDVFHSSNVVSSFLNVDRVFFSPKQNCVSSLYESDQFSANYYSQLFEHSDWSHQLQSNAKISQCLSSSSANSSNVVQELCENIDLLNVSADTNSSPSVSWAKIASQPAKNVSSTSLSKTSTAETPEKLNKRRTGRPRKSLRRSQPSKYMSSPSQKSDNSVSLYQPLGSINLRPKVARFFVIKSYSDRDVHKSVKYGIWSSTEQNNRKLDAAYQDVNGKGPLYLFFSVNGSGQFCGVAEMVSPVDRSSQPGIWCDNVKWPGSMDVRWVYIKDVPNGHFRRIRLPNNQNKSLINSRDAQEVPMAEGRAFLKCLDAYTPVSSSIIDHNQGSSEPSS